MVEHLYLVHHGTLGQKWGMRRWQNKDGSLTPEGKDHYGKKVFISGSSKTQLKDSPYYRKHIPKKVKRQINKSMKNNDEILIGDAPGIDTQVQQYLNKKHYKNVTVYATDKSRTNIGGWNEKIVDGSKYKNDIDSYRTLKDKAMQKDADKGIAVVLENGGAGATRNNIQALIKANKSVYVYELKANKKDTEAKEFINNYLERKK